MNVHEGGNCLDLGTLLCMIDKVSLAGLIFGVPVENIELDASCKQTDWSKNAGCIILEDCLIEAVDPVPE